VDITDYHPLIVYHSLKSVTIGARMRMHPHLINTISYSLKSVKNAIFFMSKFDCT